MCKPDARLAPYALAALSFLTPVAAVADSSYKTLSDALAVGLPAVAAGISWAQDDTAGLWQLAKAETVTLATTGVLKSTVSETRPNGRDDRSFPSGHTAMAFSAAHYMQMRNGWQFGVPAYVAATLVGYGRVRADEHYWKDVVAGAALGMAASYYFTDSRERTRFSVSATPRGAYAQMVTSW